MSKLPRVSPAPPLTQSSTALIHCVACALWLHCPTRANRSRGARNQPGRKRERPPVSPSLAHRLRRPKYAALPAPPPFSQARNPWKHAKSRRPLATGLLDSAPASSAATVASPCRQNVLEPRIYARLHNRLVYSLHSPSTADCVPLVFGLRQWDRNALVQEAYRPHFRW